MLRFDPLRISEIQPLNPQSAADNAAEAIKSQQQQLRLRKKQLQMDKLRKRERELAAEITASAKAT